MAKIPKDRDNTRVKVDKKGRVMIPAHIRKRLKGEVTFYLTEGAGPYILMFREEEWERAISQYHVEDPLEENVDRQKMRRLVGRMREVEMDRQGRILLPGHLVKHANIKDEVSFIQMKNWIEIWNPENFDKTLEKPEKGEENG